MQCLRITTLSTITNSAIVRHVDDDALFWRLRLDPKTHKVQSDVIEPLLPGMTAEPPLSEYWALKAGPDLILCHPSEKLATAVAEEFKSRFGISVQLERKVWHVDES